MKLLRNIYSDWMKTKNTAIRLIIYIIPVIYSSLMIWYTSRVGTQEHIYYVFFQLISVSFPIALGLLCALVCRLEEDAGGFNNILSTDSRTVAYLSKFLMIALITIYEVLGSTILLLVGMKFVLNIHDIQYILFFQGGCLCVYGSLFLITIHLVLSFAFGIGTSIAVGGAGFLAAAIVGGSIVGDNIWIYFPWSWSVRLSGLLGLRMTSIPNKNGINMLEYSNGQINFSCLIITIFTALVLFLSTIWFRRWEGKKAYE